MKDLVANITIRVNENTYLKDPSSSELGKRIISNSIDMIHELGFEKFTFGKLSKKIKSPEASIYRYFESKHKVLLYLTAWYWNWLEYRLIFAIANIESPQERLTRALGLLTKKIEEDHNFKHMDEVKLQTIVFEESMKAYFTKDVDEENKQGVFSGYKSLVAIISDIILEINPDFEFPRMLTSTVIEGVHNQYFFAQHLPRLTEADNHIEGIKTFYSNLVFNTISPKKNGTKH